MRNIIIIWVILFVLLSKIQSADIITNGDFATDLSGWSYTDNGNGTVSHDATIGSGSVMAKSNEGINLIYTTDIYQSIGPINSTDTVLVSFYWYKYVSRAFALHFNISVEITKPDLSSQVIWTNSDNPTEYTSVDGTVIDLDISTYCDQNGTYQIHLISDAQGSGNTEYTQLNWDDVVVDVLSVANLSAPTITGGATQTSVNPIYCLGDNSTVLSAEFSDSDIPDLNSFTCSFKIRYPDNSTELVLVDQKGNGYGGLTITDLGSGSYRAEYSYNPDDTQDIGLYDLYFEVFDGAYTAIDDYSNNPDELEIQAQASTNIVTNGAFPTDISGWVVSDNGNGSVSHDATIGSGSMMAKSNTGANLLYTTDIYQTVGPINSDDTVRLSFYWYKYVQRAAATQFVAQIDIVRPDYTSATVWSNTTIPAFNTSIDGTVSDLDISNEFDQDGDYQLHLITSAQGTGNTEFTQMNWDDIILDVITNPPPNNAPTVTVGTITATPATVNRLDNNSTTITADFTDLDDPGINSFNITIKIKDEGEIEYLLVDNQTNGNGGLMVTSLGSGDYQAQYIFDPSDIQPLGAYDLYFELSDGTDNAIDDYTNNIDELTITEEIPNNDPVIISSDLVVSPPVVDRIGSNEVTFDLPFTDLDQPAISSFNIIIKIRTNGVDTTIIADSLPHGSGGLTITDNGSGSYTASISYNPPDDITVGYYDLFGYVTDGVSAAVDDFNNNQNELLITSSDANNAPIIQSDATYATPAGVERLGTNYTTIKTTFTDSDLPTVDQFRVRFCLREINDIGEISLCAFAANGENGLVITDLGSGVYEASITWDPPDLQEVGFYDLGCVIADQEDTAYDWYQNNLDELQVYDAVSNHPPTINAGDLFALPVSITRIGSDFTMLKGTFTDIDMPGAGAFKVSFKIRDESLNEYTIVTLANHGEQGVRITDISGGVYEASVLYDPPIDQPTGSYDLYFYVEDNISGTAIDDYADNADELTITSEAILGDGDLLRRTNDVSTCGGSNNACHNIADHQNQECLVCHTPHSTKNIYIIKDTIETPNSGSKEVIFKTLGIGDPYNDPDPVEGDPNSGVMADETDGVFTGVCEVCHTTVGHHRNDGSQPPPNHHDAENCIDCHPHSEGFAVSGGGESSGGMSCVCHNSIYNVMDSTSFMYRHILANNEADYSPGSSNMYTIKNCLTCHVDHDIFRNDLNPGIGQRAKNMRVDWSIDPVTGDNTVLSNSDYSSSGNGGICLSCHGGVHPSGLCSGCHSAHKISGGFSNLKAASDAPHNFVAKTDYDAATATHNYNVPLTFGTDGSTFNANCIKCHNDDRKQSYQSSDNTFSMHASNYDNIFDSTGISSPVDPLEEKFCFKCHSTISNPNAGSALDFFGYKSMTNPEALDIETAFSRTYTHPTLLYSGRHTINDSSLTLGDGKRHAECSDCHSPHAALQGTHDGTSNLVSNALKGAWGVEPTGWVSTFTYTDNGQEYIAPTAYSEVRPALKEYQICLKCHSNYVTLPSTSRNIAQEINPNYPSVHGIVSAGDNPYCNANTMYEPWATNKINYCSDCHGSSVSGDPAGPHGSNIEHMLIATIVSDATNGTPLCNACHKPTVYWLGGDGSLSKFNKHPATQGQHRRAQGCFACHMWDYSSTSGLGLNSVNWAGGTPPADIIHPHGENRKWVYNEQNGSAGTGQPVENFINGYMANMDHSAKQCWSEVCKSHSGAAY